MSRYASLREYLPRRIVTPIARLIAKAGVSPNSLTILGLAIALLAASAIAWGQLIIGGILVIISGLLDLLDGAVARLLSKATTFGAVLDSTVDRLAETAVFLGIATHSLRTSSDSGVLLAIGVLAGSFLVSYIRARAEGLGLECRVGIASRGERVVIIAMGLVLQQLLIALWLLAFLVSVTVLQRLLYLAQHATPSGRGS